MQVWTLHNQVRSALLLSGGPTIIYEFPGAAHLLEEPWIICDEVRESEIFAYLCAGSAVLDRSRKWARGIAGLIEEYGGGNRRLAIDRVDPAGVFALQKKKICIEQGQYVMESAREIKSPGEIKAIRNAVKVAEAGMEIMRFEMKPGLSEQRLWSHLHQSAIASGAEWFETRLLSSGPRTAPWYQECGDRIIEEGDIVAFDTDMIGPLGYCADISRSWVCGDKPPSDTQRKLYASAYSILQRNIELLKPGIGFREYANICGDIPEQYRRRRYTVLAHGVGMADEFPLIPYKCDIDNWPNDGIFKKGMVICVESYIADNFGHEGIKLEQQVFLTDSGTELLSQFPLEEGWL